MPTGETSSKTHSKDLFPCNLLLFNFFPPNQTIKYLCCSRTSKIECIKFNLVCPWTAHCERASCLSVKEVDIVLGWVTHSYINFLISCFSMLNRSSLSSPVSVFSGMKMFCNVQGKYDQTGKVFAKVNVVTRNCKSSYSPWMFPKWKLLVVWFFFFCYSFYYSEIIKQNVILLRFSAFRHLDMVKMTWNASDWGRKET